MEPSNAVDILELNRPSRRRHLKILQGMLAAVGAKTLEDPITIHAQTRILDRVPTDYPSPTYIPTGYRLWNVYRSHPGGFGGGDEEIAEFYLNPQYVKHLNNPLQIFIATKPARPLAGTVGSPYRPVDPLVEISEHSYASVSLRFANGATGLGRYFDGRWWIVGLPNGQRRTPGDKMEYYWNTDSEHSLVFSFGTFTIGLRGYYEAAINKEELVRIAESFGGSGGRTSDS